MNRDYSFAIRLKDKNGRTFSTLVEAVAPDSWTAEEEVVEGAPLEPAVFKLGTTAAQLVRAWPLGTEFLAEQKMLSRHLSMLGDLPASVPATLEDLPAHLPFGPRNLPAHESTRAFVPEPGGAAETPPKAANGLNEPERP